jgi:hypothetical protein
MDDSYELFDWEKYIMKNNDLQMANLMTREDAWNHWTKNGKKENRIFYSKKKDSLIVKKVNESIVCLMNDYIDHLSISSTILPINKKKEFDWVSYLCSNPDLFLNGIRKREDAIIHWLEYGRRENRQCFLKEAYCMLGHEFLHFQWERYIRLNNDLKDIPDEFNAWKHWLYCGIKEERATYLINNSKIHNGRLGNLFFINMVAHFFSIKYNLKFNYKYYEQFEKLGIDFFVGENTYDENIILTDDQFYNLLCEKDFKKRNIIITNDMWCQTKAFCYALKYYFSRVKIKVNIIKKNVFKERYEKNNDLFVHLRLTDVESRVDHIYQSYDKIISEISFTNGFLSSDDLNNDICKRLIDKYKLQVYQSSEIETIMFASTCNHIVLSGGTFSWLIGFLAFFSKSIYYPRIKNKWYGDIFIFPHWEMFDTIDV